MNNRAWCFDFIQVGSLIEEFEFELTLGGLLVQTRSVVSCKIDA